MGREWRGGFPAVSSGQSSLRRHRAGGGVYSLIIEAGFGRLLAACNAMLKPASTIGNDAADWYNDELLGEL
jgi:hypothetical protein